jgi:hypothetical protein
MAEQLDDGGPAFPVPDLPDWSGMSLFEYFAAHAPKQVPDDACDVERWSRMCACPLPENADDHVAWTEFWARCEAVLRYRYADAMLAERERWMKP